MRFEEHYLEESEFVEDYPVKYFGKEYNLNIYKDPNGSELYKIYKDNQGEGGCRIGIDSMNVVYCWIDNVDHLFIEMKFDLDFSVKKFSIPSMNSDTIYWSGESGINEIKALQAKKLFMIFQNVRYIKTDGTHTIIYDKEKLR